ncbi:hypothetical protein QRW90_16605 [Clostridioides difficile]|uniref:hypothetical protein n=1 Tax=Clostridioides difficile TaxID=1496 RepID=UPI001266D113|nr:hypothetical protein [Clostridioides difficile]MDL5120603.1 hypothetical protein [Clostridioides difficile]QFS33401.1 hypothetical protein FTB24_19375 [Clostridioides difficile]QIF80170.1 hypothetical protein EUU24_16995 [Clostridioides difficile]
MSNLDSLDAVKDFLSLGSKKDGIVSFSVFLLIPNLSNKVNVTIGSYMDSYNVNINWEDEPYGLKNYKDYDLFGYYSTKYCKIEYDITSNTLTITNSNRRKIMLTY